MDLEALYVVLFSMADFALLGIMFFAWRSNLRDKRIFLLKQYHQKINRQKKCDHEYKRYTDSHPDYPFTCMNCGKLL